MKETLIRNYVNWIKTTTNQEHREYARQMLAAVYDGTHAQVFKHYGDVRNCNKKQTV